MKLIIGLGNPGKKYENTRHNVGFDVVSELARRVSHESPRVRFEGLTVEGQSAGQRLLLLWPHTYMNLSGRSVAAAMNFYKLSPGKALVVCDEFQLLLGKLRVRARGSSGGQKGLENVIQHLGTEEVCRLRVGVGPVPERWDPANFVLGKFSTQERETMDVTIATAADAIECWVAHGTEETMNQFN